MAAATDAGRAATSSSAMRSTSAMSSSVTVSICHPTRCSSRRRRASWAWPSTVRCSGWMSSSTPHLTSGTARSRRIERPLDGRITLVWCSTGTPRRRSASARTTSGWDSLGADPPSAASVRRNTPDPGRAGCPRRRSMATSSSRGHLSTRGGAAGRPTGDRAGGGRRRGRTPGAATRRRRCRRRATRRSIAQMTVVWRNRTPGSSGRWTPWRTEKCNAARRGMRRSPASVAGGRAGDEPAAVGGATARRSAARPCAARTSTTNTPWPTRRSTPRSTRRRVAVAPTPCSRSTCGGDDAVVVGEPAHGLGGSVTAIGPPRDGKSEGDVGVSARTQGVRAHPSAGARTPRTQHSDGAEHSDGAGSGGAAVAGLGEAEDAEEEQADGGAPQERRGPSPSRPAPAATRRCPCSRLGSYCTAATTKKMPEMNSTSDLAA